jgi:CRP/FNR family cyclic AMP-dependent transcriptional regulator
LKAMKGKSRHRASPPRFDLEDFLGSAGVSQKVVEFRRNARVFSQGDTASEIYYIQEGAVRLSVVSASGKEAVVGMMGPADFFGEGCLAGQGVRMGSATAVLPTRVRVVEKKKMVRLLHEQPALADRFITYVLGRNIRIEEDLIDQLFNSSEKRLARALLLLARYGMEGPPRKMKVKVSQEVLAGMVGTTRSRVNYFMNKFRKLGFIDYNGGVHINDALLSVVLHE